MDYARKIAEAALERGAVTINPTVPYEWASGYFMPIYSDFRKLLRKPEHRKLVDDALVQLIEENKIKPEVIAGTVTAGVPFARGLADKLDLPLIYVRNTKKEYGLQNAVEGILYPGEMVLVVEELMSTGNSSFTAVQNVRYAGGVCNWCVSIFSYGFDEAVKIFKEGDCKTASALYFEKLVETALDVRKIDEKQLAVLREWRSDPFNWGAKHGFPKVEKKK